jgi:hypothetical protein
MFVQIHVENFSTFRLTTIEHVSLSYDVYRADAERLEGSCDAVNLLPVGRNELHVPKHVLGLCADAWQKNGCTLLLSCRVKVHCHLVVSELFLETPPVVGHTTFSDRKWLPVAWHI